MLQVRLKLRSIFTNIFIDSSMRLACRAPSHRCGFVSSIIGGCITHINRFESRFCGPLIARNRVQLVNRKKILHFLKVFSEKLLSVEKGVLRLLSNLVILLQIICFISYFFLLFPGDFLLCRLTCQSLGQLYCQMCCRLGHQLLCQLLF